MFGYDRLPIDIRLSGEPGRLNLFTLQSQGVLWGYYSYDLSFDRGIWDLYLIPGGDALVVWFSGLLVVMEYKLRHFHLFSKLIVHSYTETSGLVIMEDDDEQVLCRLHSGILVELSRKSLKRP